nr:uncharacterized protein LOC117220827 [Megalopta genalis]
MADKEDKMEIAVSEFRNAKLPNFWREEPKLWFAMLEREFAAYTVKADAVKCAAVIRHLDTASMKVVADVIAAPPTDDSYIQIKEALISRLATSEETQLRQLLSGIDLQNKRPSELLREMTLLAGKNVSDSALCTLWLQRLPARIQEVLSVVEGVSTEKLALLADKTIERSSQYELAEMAAQPRDSYSSSEIAELIKRIAQLEASIRDTHRGRRPERKKFRRYSSKSRSRTRDDGLCYFHRKFGENSWKCRQPCQWKGLDKRKSQGN